MERLVGAEPKGHRKGLFAFTSVQFWNLAGCFLRLYHLPVAALEFIPWAFAFYWAFCCSSADMFRNGRVERTAITGTGVKADPGADRDGNEPVSGGRIDSIEEDYQEIIEELLREETAPVGRPDRMPDMSEMADYYTTWAHQIKDPESQPCSCNLGQGGQDAPLARNVDGGPAADRAGTLEMALCYLRLKFRGGNRLCDPAGVPWTKLSGRRLKKLCRTVYP